jgi:predicted Zn-dependent protease
VVLGNNPNMLAEIAAGLGALSFSRDFEREADQYSVAYLNGTSYYACDGAAAFFSKAEAQSQGNPTKFLSMHPNPGSRTEAIAARATELGCRTHEVSHSGFTELKSLL